MATRAVSVRPGGPWDHEMDADGYLAPVLRLITIVTLFFASNLFVFFALGKLHVPVGIAFFLWVGVFNYMVIAQFWSFAAFFSSSTFFRCDSRNSVGFMNPRMYSRSTLM